jgi:S-DNA-T family DNA segregation ATPase FtsK/SpoIIIE
MTVWANERVAVSATVRQPERAESGTAAEFNFWCAVNSLPFQLVSHAWPDGSIEWGVEYAVGEPAETIAYGTGQQDEALAVLLAYAFAAGVEWGHATPDWRGDTVVEIVDEEDEAQLETKAAVVTSNVKTSTPAPKAPTQPQPIRTLSPILARLSGAGIEAPQRAAPPEPMSLSLPNEKIGLAIPAVETPISRLSLTLAAMGATPQGASASSVAPQNITHQTVTHQRVGSQTIANQTVFGQNGDPSVPSPSPHQEPAVEPVCAEKTSSLINGLSASAIAVHLEPSGDLGDPTAPFVDEIAVIMEELDRGLPTETAALTPSFEPPVPTAAITAPRPIKPAHAETVAGEELVAPPINLPALIPSQFDLPAVELLNAPPASQSAPLDEVTLAANARQLETVLQNFNVRGEIMEVRPGPVVTLYELEPAPGTKSARVIGLADDIARSMSALSVRIAVVPGRSVIGIEMPNPKRETVFLREMLGAAAYLNNEHRLPLMLGKNIGGDPIVADLARMPHLLIAGTTGSGKSVGINTMILSLLYRLSPQQCRFIMIDPKMLELSVYDGIPHLLTPVVTDPKKAILALKWAVREMEERYRAMAKVGVRNIDGYNAHLAEHPTLTEAPLPYIVVVVDEMADLMMVAGKEIEAAIQRLAQMARAAGIHLIMATQRPSVDVITGTIKANFPTRISFQVTSKIDSRTILGEAGADQLLGQGDMLFMAGGGRITRVHGPFVSDGEVESVVRHLKAQGAPSFVDGITDEEEEDAIEAYENDSGGMGGDDDVYNNAVALVIREKKCSISFIQRHLQIGYNRSARIVERMENEGVIGQPNHVGKREVIGRRAPRED